ncbi:hypothetical protein TSAR_011366 [Trichomalopsis sarcophagae]|uniref:Uncharacterized protein n=1 Tax=Trichomalopsis sarcophagae TaxID=543379 RepID=A0A232EV53_9HYME|nr:hypothetical protein TSAR_011366 [Trichomalopsis sarcophagae]
MHLLLAAVLLLSLLGEKVQSGARNSEMASILHRPIRAISYPSNSNMGIFVAIAVPLEDPVNSVSLSYFFEASYGLPDNSSYYLLPAGIERSRRKRGIDRATVYALLQSRLQSSAGFPGHECLLRSICEASEYPLEHNGLLGDVFRVVFTPSSSRPEDHLPDGIVEAELKGRNATCQDYHAGCPIGLFDLIGVLQ